MRDAPKYLDAVGEWYRERRQAFDRLLLPMVQAHGPCPAPVREALWSAYNMAWSVGHPGRLYPPNTPAARRMYLNWKRRKCMQT
ncbi:MAG: hypothetical protein ACYSWU_10100 [Planctomycetota bacterium]|jgi:hypothetical protein